MIKKRCRMCRSFKPLHKMVKNGQLRIGYEARCKGCRNHRKREIYAEDLKNARGQGKWAAQKSRDKYRLMVIRHYGGRCFICAESYPYFLSIIASKESGLASLSMKNIGSQTFYKMIVDHGYPPGVHVVCHNCMVLTRRWSPERIRKQLHQWYSQMGRQRPA